MSKWEMVRLGDVADVITKGTTPTTLGYRFEDSGINFIKIESISEIGDFLINKFVYISNECNNKLKRSKLKINDILFSIAGALGRTAIVTSSVLPANINQALAIIRISDDGINLKYIQLALKSKHVYNQFQKQKQGVAQLNLSLKNIADLIIPLPPLNEQKKIADILDKARALITLRKEQIAKIDLLVKSRFIEMFGDPVTNPMGWEINKLSNLSSKITDGVHAKPTYTDTGMPFISVVNITKRFVDFTKCKFVSNEDYNKMIKSTHPEKGDILYTKVGATYGIPAYIDTDKKFCLYVSVCLIKPLHRKINAKFLASSMCMPYIKRQADQRIRGIGVPDLHLNQIREFDICCPPSELQEKFADFVNQAETQKSTMQKGLEILEVQYKALMQEYFGE